MAARGNEVQIAADAGLGRMHVAEVVRAIDDPEFLVAGGEVENLFVFGKDDERRKAELGADRNNVFLRILHDTRAASVAACVVEAWKTAAPTARTSKQREGKSCATDGERFVSLIYSF